MCTVILGVTSGTDINYGHILPIEKYVLNFDPQINIIGDQVVCNFDYYLYTYNGFDDFVDILRSAGLSHKIIGNGQPDKVTGALLMHRFGIPTPDIVYTTKTNKNYNGSLIGSLVERYLDESHADSVEFICKPRQETRATKQFKISSDDCGVLSNHYASEFLPIDFDTSINTDRYSAQPCVCASNVDVDVIPNAPIDATEFATKHLNLDNPSSFVLCINTDDKYNENQSTRHEYRVVQGFGVDGISSLSRKMSDVNTWVYVEGGDSCVGMQTSDSVLYNIFIKKQIQQLMEETNSPFIVVDFYTYATSTQKSCGVYEISNELGLSRHKPSSVDNTTRKVMVHGLSNLIEYLDGNTKLKGLHEHERNN